MKARANYHTHTWRCGHATGTAREYVEAAIAHGFERIGFSEHMPIADADIDARMPYDQLHEYVAELRLLREEFGERIEIEIGLEAEWIPELRNYYEWLLGEAGIEYLALGQHYFTDCHLFDERAYYGPAQWKLISTYCITTPASYADYAHAVCDAVSSGFFRFVAHPDLLFYNDFPFGQEAEEASRQIISCAMDNDTPLEVNANGVRRGLVNFGEEERYLYPYHRFWAIASSMEAKCIVGSDCHAVSLLQDEYVDKAYALAQEWRLTLTELRGVRG